MFQVCPEEKTFPDRYMIGKVFESRENDVHMAVNSSFVLLLVEYGGICPHKPLYLSPPSLLDNKRIRKHAVFHLFEINHENNTKCSNIYIPKQKNIQKSSKLPKLDKRLERAEANIFGHEKRISNLEMNS